jgi:hypothetical protein
MGAAKMSEFWDSHEVRFELTGPEIYWLEKQSRFCRDGTVEILTAAMAEWLPRNPDQCITPETVKVILREALDEFIARHKAEFL